MLPKALFLSTIEKIRQQEARIDEFDKALSKMCDGFPAFDKDNLYLLALRDLLKYTMQDQYDNIGWWLYEAPDAGYTVSWEEAGKEVSVDLTEAGALYVKKSGCEFLIYKQNDDNLNRNQRKIDATTCRFQCCVPRRCRSILCAGDDAWRQRQWTTWPAPALS